MSSEPIRDPVSDRLLTPQNAAFIVIDYQPVQVNSIASMERQLLVSNILRASKAALLYGLPIVLSTVNVQSGINKPTISALRKLLDKVPSYDRTTINAWEDVRFRKMRSTASCSDWARNETVPGFMTLFFDMGGSAR